MHPLMKTLLLVSACLFVFGSAQAQEATDDSQVTNEARQAKRDKAGNRDGRNRDEMRQRAENMPDKQRQAMRQRRENMSDKERAAMRERRQDNGAARNSQRQRPAGTGRPKRDQAE
jgi:hypothetical protein